MDARAKGGSFQIEPEIFCQKGLIHCKVWRFQCQSVASASGGRPRCSFLAPASPARNTRDQNSNCRAPPTIFQLKLPGRANNHVFYFSSPNTNSR